MKRTSFEVVVFMLLVCLYQVVSANYFSFAANSLFEIDENTGEVTTLYTYDSPQSQNFLVGSVRQQKIFIATVTPQNETIVDFFDLQQNKITQSVSLGHQPDKNSVMGFSEATQTLFYYNFGQFYKITMDGNASKLTSSGYLNGNFLVDDEYGFIIYGYPECAACGTLLTCFYYTDGKECNSAPPPLVSWGYPWFNTGNNNETFVTDNANIDQITISSNFTILNITQLTPATKQIPTRLGVFNAKKNSIVGSFFSNVFTGFNVDTFEVTTLKVSCTHTLVPNVWIG